MRKTFVDELFALEAFTKTLAALKPSVATLCDKTFADLPGFEEPDVPSLPLGAVAEPLLDQLSRLARARAFAMWRARNDAAVKAAVRTILGTGGSSDTGISETSPIGARLNALENTVKGTAPINAALSLCARMKEALKMRRTKEARLKLYIEAQAALELLSRSVGWPKRRSPRFKISFTPARSIGGSNVIKTPTTVLGLPCAKRR